MICPKCGYAMQAFDRECPRCHGQGVATPAPQEAAKPAATAVWAPPSPTPPPAPTPAPVSTPEQKARAESQGKLVGRILLVALLLFVANSLFRRSSSQPVVFDVPALFGKNIVEVTGALGKPARQTLPEADVLANMQKGYIDSDWHFIWKRGDWSLHVEFDLRDRRVIDYFLSPSGLLNDPADALAAGNLSSSASTYTVRPVPALGHPGKYTGITITPR